MHADIINIMHAAANINSSTTEGCTHDAGGAEIHFPSQRCILSRMAILGRPAMVTTGAVSTQSQSIDQAVTHLQAVARGRAVRRAHKLLAASAAHLVLAAIRMQAAARGFLQRLVDNNIIAEAADYVWAATIIQSSARMRLVRIRYLREYFHDFDGIWDEMMEVVEGGGLLEPLTMRRVRATLFRERRGLLRIQAVARGRRARAMLRPFAELQAALADTRLSSATRIGMVFGACGALRVYSTEPYPELVLRYAPQVEALRKAEEAAARKKVSNKRQRDKKKQAKKDAKKKAERDELSSGAPHKIGGVLYEIGGKHGIQPSAKAARGGGNVGGTQLSPIQLDCLRAARRCGEDEPDWGAYWTRLAEHQEAAGQHLAASMTRREAAYETVPWHQAAHAAASGWP